MDSKINKEALSYHSNRRPGKPCNSSFDLALAYLPGVAEPCRKIAANPSDVYKYTLKGNLVAIITNGTAILDSNDWGPLASKPAMEGKAMLMKKYADINAYDIELNTTDIDVFVRTVITLSPTFGAIHLEDIKAPECIEIEKRLIDALDIPVMHDNTHGTAIVTSAALLNACEIAGKKPENIKLVINGSGAAAMACAELFSGLGLKKENIIMLDHNGVIATNRFDLDQYKQKYAIHSNLKTLEQALYSADAFVGLSKGNPLTQAMIQSMAKNPIVFTLAYPNPEIANNKSLKTKYGMIYASRYRDTSNQINNVLAFPYIFRAALDVRAGKINTEMKIAAVYALAALAKEPYLNLDSKKKLTFGRDYFIPKPSDFRLMRTLAPAVAKAAIESGAATQRIADFNAYAKDADQRIMK